METYKVTVFPYPYSNKVERWFSTKHEAKDYAKYQIKLGWAPHIEVFNESYTESKRVLFPSVAVSMFWNGVF
jgi:hypothetical protein